MNIKPLTDNLIIKEKKIEEKSKTGIVLTTNNEEQTLTGEVIATGKDVEEIKKGDKVVYAPYSGKQIGGMLIISQSDIMGIVAKKE